MHFSLPTAHSARGPQTTQMGSSNIAGIHDLIREPVLLQSIFQMQRSKRSTIGREKGLKRIKI